MKDRQFFMNPGPTPVPERVKQASLRPLCSHRSQEFTSLLQETIERLKLIFATPEEILLLTCSGTGAMEAALGSLFREKERILGVRIGTFGDRFITIASRLGLIVDTLHYQEGEAAPPEEILDYIKRAPYPFAGLLITHHETTTGILNDIKGLAYLLAELPSPPLLIVDAISSLGAVELKTKEWGIDVVITASQKALMTPPGLSIISLSERAEKVMESKRPHSFYLDLKRASLAANRGETPYTPAISLIFALREALCMIEEEGLREVFQRHIILKDALREGMRAIGVKPFAPDTIASPALTTFLPPEGVDVHKLRRLMAREYGVILAGGKGELKEKILRIAHMGYFSRLDIIATLSALEMALLQLGVEIEAGESVAAAEMSFLKEVVEDEEDLNY